MKMKKIGVVGVQEAVGREILSFLAEDGVKAADVVALEPRAVMGSQVSYGEDDELDVLNLDDYDLSKLEVLIFAAPAEMVKKYAVAAAKKVKVIDCSNAFFENADVPLLVAGVNDEQLEQASGGIVSLPSPEVAQLLQVLSPLHRRCKLRRVVVTSYTSTSVYGKDAMDELFNQTRRIFMNDTLADDQQVFHKQIAFNVIPQVDEFIGEETAAEWAFNAEIKKILGADVKVHANCAVVPVFIGSAMYVNAEFAEETDVDQARKLLEETPGLVVFDKHVDGGYVTMTDVQGEDNVYVSRLRQDISVENGVSFWCVADNLRAGAARNAFAVLKQILARH